MLFEIGRKIPYAVLLRGALPPLVQPIRVFVRAERQRRAKPSKAVCFGNFRRLAKAQSVTNVTALAPFRLLFQPANGVGKRRFVVVAIDKVRPARFLQETDLFRFALGVLFIVVDIGVVIQHSDGKMIF